MKYRIWYIQKGRDFTPDLQQFADYTDVKDISNFFAYLKATNDGYIQKIEIIQDAPEEMLKEEFYKEHGFDEMVNYYNNIFDPGT